MKKISSITLLLALFAVMVFSQNLTQTVRGIVIDADSKLPLIGVTMVIMGTDPVIGTITDVNGNFKIKNTPIGRITLQLSYIG